MIDLYINQITKHGQVVILWMSQNWISQKAILGHCGPDEVQALPMVPADNNLIAVNEDLLPFDDELVVQDKRARISAI